MFEKNVTLYMNPYSHLHETLSLHAQTVLNTLQLAASQFWFQ